MENDAKEENSLADRVARKILSSVYPQFGTGSVPTKVAAQVFGKSETWVREGIKNKLLPIGVVTETEQRTNVYISPKLLWEFTGYAWKGEKEAYGRN
jgi:hypothetical protein|nr:MAG TPA: hypothetical protein [Caudoviricetes sp.]